MLSRFPVLLFFAEPDGSVSWLANLPEDLAEGRHVAFVLLPPATLGQVARRDIERDLSDPQRALREVRRRGGPEAVRRHRWLLGEIRAQHHLHGLRAALGDLLIAEDLEGFRSVLRRERRLKGREVRRMVEREVRESDGDPRPAMAQALLDDLPLGPQRAFAKHQARMRQLGDDLGDTREEWERRLEAATEPDERIRVVDEVLEHDPYVAADDELRGRLLATKGTALTHRREGNRGDTSSPRGPAQHVAQYQRPDEWRCTSRWSNDHCLGLVISTDGGYGASGRMPLVGQNVTYTSATTGSATIVHWDLDGDGEFDDGMGDSAVAQFNTPGAHTVKAKVFDALLLQPPVTAELTLDYFFGRPIAGGPSSPEDQILLRGLRQAQPGSPQWRFCDCADDRCTRHTYGDATPNPRRHLR